MTVRDGRAERERTYAQIFKEACEAERVIQNGLRRHSHDDTRHVDVWIHDGSIRPAMADTVIRAIHAAPHAETIHVHIHSPGGDVLQALHIIAALWGSNAKVTAYATAACSAALIIFTACDRRIAHPQARFLSHSPSNASQSRLDQVTEVKNRIFQRAGLSQPVMTTLRDQGDKHRDFSAQEALAAGIATRVESFPLRGRPPDVLAAERSFDRQTPEGREAIRVRIQRKRNASARRPKPIAEWPAIPAGLTIC
jgi:ATP-dependent protease ClpP protease subunit